MDKWREIELAKMRVGGNQKARDFLESQSDYRPKWTMQEKYMSRASALLREKVFRHSSKRALNLLRGFSSATLDSSRG